MNKHNTKEHPPKVNKYLAKERVKPMLNLPPASTQGKNKKRGRDMNEIQPLRQCASLHIHTKC